MRSGLLGERRGWFAVGGKWSGFIVKLSCYTETTPHGCRRKSMHLPGRCVNREYFVFIS